MNIEGRKLCTDGGCIGVLDEAGDCPVCGLNARTGHRVSTAPVTAQTSTVSAPAVRGDVIAFFKHEQKTPFRRFARGLLLLLICVAGIFLLLVAIVLGHPFVSDILQQRRIAALNDANEQEIAALAQAKSERVLQAWYSSHCRTTHVEPKQRCFFCRDVLFPEPATKQERKISTHLGGPESIHHGVTFCKEGDGN